VRAADVHHRQGAGKMPRRVFSGARVNRRTPQALKAAGKRPSLAGVASNAARRPRGKKNGSGTLSQVSPPQAVCQ